MRIANRSTIYKRLNNKYYTFDYITILVNLISRKGFKLYAYKIVFEFVLHVKVKYNMRMIALFDKVFSKYIPVFGFINKKIATTIHQLPWLIDINRAKTLVLKWFLYASFLRTEQDIVMKLINEFDEVWLGYGKTIKCLEEYYQIAKKNLPFMHLLRGRRNVVVSRLKKYGIR